MRTLSEISRELKRLGRLGPGAAPAIAVLEHDLSQLDISVMFGDDCDLALRAFFWLHQDDDTPPSTLLKPSPKG